MLVLPGEAKLASPVRCEKPLLLVMREAESVDKQSSISNDSPSVAGLETSREGTPPIWLREDCKPAAIWALFSDLQVDPAWMLAPVAETSSFFKSRKHFEQSPSVFDDP